MLVKRKPLHPRVSEPAEMSPTREELVSFREGGRLLGGVPESTMRQKATEMGLTIVNLNDGIPRSATDKPVLRKNCQRLIKSQVLRIAELAVEEAREKERIISGLIDSL